MIIDKNGQKIMTNTGKMSIKEQQNTNKAIFITQQTAQMQQQNHGTYNTLNMEGKKNLNAVTIRFQSKHNNLVLGIDDQNDQKAKVYAAGSSTISIQFDQIDATSYQSVATGHMLHEINNNQISADQLVLGAKQDWIKQTENLAPGYHYLKLDSTNPPLYVTIQNDSVGQLIKTKQKDPNNMNKQLWRNVVINSPPK